MKADLRSYRDAALVPGARAVIVDPDGEATRVLAAALRSLGCRVEIAGTWQWLQLSLRRERADWIFCDLTRLEMDRIRNVLEMHPRTRIIALVRGGNVDRLAAAIDAIERGAHDFLVKPANLDTVTGVLLAWRHRRAP